MMYNRRMLVMMYLLFWIVSLINGTGTDLSALTIDQAQTWLNAISQINNINFDSRIYIVRLGDGIEISLYKNQDDIPPENRYLFKQNINKRIDCYLDRNQINSLLSSGIYDSCHGTLSSREVSSTIAGTYVYTGNQTSSALGLIVVQITKSLYWFNGTKSYPFNKLSPIRNGTQLNLGFECEFYYNSNSDLIALNKKINDLVQQANISIEQNVEDNLERFLFMENLSCQRHEQIVNDDLRMLVIVCTTMVTFKCPLTIGSSCWIENKSLSNIQLNIDSHTFLSDKTLTVRIDV